MRTAVKRIFNLKQYLGGDYSNYTVEQEIEHTEKINPKIVYAYLNNLIEESFYHYLLMNVENLNPELLEEVTNNFRTRTKNRIKYYNKIYRLGE
jgi:hypothetical protein